MAVLLVPTLLTLGKRIAPHSGRGSSRLDDGCVSVRHQLVQGTPTCPTGRGRSCGEPGLRRAVATHAKRWAGSLPA